MKEYESKIKELDIVFDVLRDEAQERIEKNELTYAQAMLDVLNIVQDIKKQLLKDVE